MSYAAEDLGFNKGEAFIIEWQYGYGGSFTKALAQAICAADVFNLIKLELGFPEEVKAFRYYQGIRGWWTKVQEDYEKLTS